MGSKTFNGVRFSAYPLDHEPAHVHGFHAGITVIVVLLEGTVKLALRHDNVSPVNAKRADITHILRTAEKHLGKL